jgi:hypothetical protein
MNMKNWLRKHDACPEGYAWAVSNCSTMQEVWDTAKPEWLVWVATRPGVLDDITLRRFACWCARQVWHLLTDERSRHAVETAERFCDGKATREKLHVVRDKAWAAAMVVWNSPLAFTIDDTIALAMAVAWYVTSNAARNAALNASISSAKALDSTSARGDQATWLRQNATPNFEDHHD